MMKKNGFSLLELLIVVSIILIIATIAIPSLLRSRQAANETGSAAAEVLSSTQSMERRSADMRSLIGNFLVKVRES